MRTERQTRAEHHAQATSKGEKLQREISKLQQQAAARHQFVANSADEEMRAEFERHGQALKQVLSQLGSFLLSFCSKFQCICAVETTTQYLAEIEHLESKLADDQTEHNEAEQDHKKRLTRLSDETTNIISDYDYNMTEKTRTHTRLNEMYSCVDCLDSSCEVPLPSLVFAT